ncbi:retrovirus-related pol polyprotein from transposon TNT 1-94 [Tanacetum coccineum]
MAKASSSQAWLWHRRLSHLNFDTINLFSKYDIMTDLHKLKFVKDHLCSSCELGKAKHKSFKTKTTPSSKRRLQILHMDLCGPMRVESFNGKKYVLVIINDYSRYTWAHFLRSKDETPEVLIDFLKLVQRGLHAQVRTVQTDKGTELLNKTLHAYFAQEGIEHQTSTARTPEENGVVKRQNRTLVEATRTMLSAAKVPLFFWAKAVATTCFTQNLSLVIPRHEKTPYHIINGRKPSVKFFHIFGSLCNIVKDDENLDKIKEKAFEQDNLSPSPQSQENVPHADETVTTSHQEVQKIVTNEIAPIVNQVYARVQNFKIQFMKEVAKFVRDFKSLAKEADESFAKHKTLEFKIERLLRLSVSQDILSIVQNNSIVDTSNLQTELDRTKERFENCIIKKENEYAKLWNDWFQKCEECKYDKILYDKAYHDMQRQIK